MRPCVRTERRCENRTARQQATAASETAPNDEISSEQQRLARRRLSLWRGVGRGRYVYTRGSVITAAVVYLEEPHATKR